MLQLILHLWGDYILQSDWMAKNKRKSWWAAVCHATAYTLPFLLITRSPLALFVIWSTHLLIDRFGLARIVCYLKNFIAPSSEIWKHKEKDIHPEMADEFVDRLKWENCKATGYPPDVPDWMAVWLLIIADNTLHLTINFLALKYL